VTSEWRRLHNKEDLKERDHSEGILLDETILLKWIIKKLDGKAQTGLSWVRTGTCGGS
jgi:hypothetical protein